MAVPVRLFDLFGDFTSAWPSTALRDHIGHDLGTPPSPATWLAALNNSVMLGEVRTGATADRVSVEAKLHTTGYLGYTLGWPLNFTSMPDVLLRVLPFTNLTDAIRLFASQSDAGIDVVLEGVPVEIQLPAGLVAPPASTTPGVHTKTVGTFSPGTLDALKVVYNETDATSIFAHVRIHATADGQFEITTAVPISLEKCRFSGLPVTAVHDFRLIPTPELAPDGIEWLRHPITPWWPAGSGPYDGLFAFRALDLDTNAEPLKDAADRLRTMNTDGPPTGSAVPADSGTELVLADTVVPWWSPWVIPVPRHVTVGLRRRVLEPSDPHQVYDFSRAPVNVRLARDPQVNFIVDSFFYRSIPLDQAGTDLGLTFQAAVVFGQNTSNPAALTVGLGENYTPRIGYRRQFLDNRTPDPGQGALATLNQALHLEIAGLLIVDVMGIQIGYSLGKAIGENKGFADCAEATVDLWVSMPPTGSDTSAFRLRGLSGEKVAFAIEGLGWRQGSFHLEGVSMPDGVVIMIANVVGIVVQEIGISAEQGASYFSVTAGLLVKLPSGFEGGAGVTRLRFRIAGDPSRPSWKLDGFWLRAKGPTFLLEAGGYFTDLVVDDTHVREFGFSGTFGIKLQAVEWVFGLDLIVGKRETPAAAPTESFGYFMVQVFFRGSIPIAWFELRGARVLFSDNMRPKLAPADPSSRDLRYFNWYRNSNPIDVPGDRRLAAWQAENEAWSFGIGVGASIAQLGKAIELGLFVLGLGGPTEGGVLIVAEVRLLSSPKPVAYAAIEWDAKHDRFSVLIGVDLKLDTFVKSIPQWLSEIAKLTGTLYISNDPATFAIGRLADQRTWLSITFDWELWARTYFQIGLCIEIVGNGGPKGFGVLARVEGGINAGVVAVTYGAGISFVVEVFTTGSTDYAATFTIGAFLRLTVFGFLHFGISAGVEFRAVGAHPSRGELRAEFRLETPWFLPDITWTLEVAFGQVVVEGLATSVQPLRSSSANGGGDRKSLPVHVERFDRTWDGDGTAPVHSIAELQAAPASEADRLSRFAADAAALPVATDATIPVEFSVGVNDKLGLGSGTAPAMGDQKSGELTLAYDLVGLKIRRRPRFGTPRPWTQVDERIELTTDFSDPAGVQLTGGFSAQEITAFWDADVKADGAIATKKLLINSKTPFDFATVNPESDEQIADDHPGWPCCDKDRKDVLTWLTQHRVDYESVPYGTHVEPPRAFSASASVLQWLRPTRTRDAGGIHAAVSEYAGAPGTIARATFDEDAAFVMVRLMPPRGDARLTLVALDAAGREVGRKDAPGGTGQFVTVLVPAQGPIRRLDLRVTGGGIHLGTYAVGPQSPLLAFQWAAYISLDEYIAHLTEDAACGAGTSSFADAYSGRGKVAWLPNHEYEIEVTTRVTGRHPSVSAKSADVREFVYFKTKGHPGLNAVERVGAEVEPYVQRAYAGGRGRLYRVEPVTIAFDEDYAPAVPLAARPAGTSAERTELLRLALTARPAVATGPGTTSFTAVGPDWLTAHRVIVATPLDTIWGSVASLSERRKLPLRSTDPMLERLAGLTQRPTVDCGLDDPRDANGSLLVAPPQGTPDPVVAGGELWPAGAQLSAVVRPFGSGHVEREAFLAGDDTAFTFALDGGAGPAGDWSVTDGRLAVAGSAVRRYAIFGDDDWDHLTIVVSAAADAAAFGVGVGLPAGATPASGLFAVVERTGATRRIAIYRRSGAGAPAEVAATPLPAPADPAAPITLEVTAFDDELQARVGEARVQVARAGQRAGRCCLIATGPARFASLAVHGLEVFGFPVGVSRFRSFEEHVHSFDGALAALAADMLGPGTSTVTVANLWTATATEVAAAMAPTADPGVRQALFDRWIAGLGLPLRTDLAGLSIGAVRDAAGATTALLLESPEPLDFTEEVSARLTRRVGVWTPYHRGDLGDIGLSEHLRALDGAVVETLTPLPPEPLPVTVTAIGRHPEGVRVDLASTAGGLRTGQPVSVARAGAAGDAPRFFAGTIARADGTTATLVAREIAAHDADGTLAELLEPHTTAVGVAGHVAQLGHWVYHDEPVPIQILQDRDGLRALFVPVTAGAAVALTAGDHHLTLELDRERYATTAAADATSRYAASAGVGLRI